MGLTCYCPIRPSEGIGKSCDFFPTTAISIHSPLSAGLDKARQSSVNVNLQLHIKPSSIGSTGPSRSFRTTEPRLVLLRRPCPSLTRIGPSTIIDNQASDRVNHNIGPENRQVDPHRRLSEIGAPIGVLHALSLCLFEQTGLLRLYFRNSLSSRRLTLHDTPLLPSRHYCCAPLKL